MPHSFLTKHSTSDWNCYRFRRRNHSPSEAHGSPLTQRPTWLILELDTKRSMRVTFPRIASCLKPAGGEWFTALTLANLKTWRRCSTGLWICLFANWHIFRLSTFLDIFTDAE